MIKTENNLKVKIVNAICGSGKSYNLKQHIRSNPDKNILIAVPTHALAEQTQSDLQKLGIPSYHNRVDKGLSATRALVNALDEGFGRNIILVTHECLLHFSLFAYRDEPTQRKLNNFEIFIDEIPSAWYGAEVDYKNLQYRDSNFPFLEWLEEREGLHYIRDEHLDKFHAYYESEHANSKLLKQALFAMLTGQGMILEQDRYFFSFTANPIVFCAQWAKSFTILGANVGISEFAFAAKTILNTNITLADDEFQPDLQRRMHMNTNRIELIPLFNQKCTKALVEENYSDILNTTNRILREKFIFATNNDEQHSNGFYYSTRADDALEGGERVSMSSYGLNHFQHLSRAAFMGCANLDGTTVGHWRKYCDMNGWDWKQLEEKRQAAMNYEKVYQFVSRCSVRIQGNSEKQIYIVPDVGCAEYLREHYFSEAIIKTEIIKIKSKGDNTLSIVKKYLEQDLKPKQIAELTGLESRYISNIKLKLKKAA